MYYIQSLLHNPDFIATLCGITAFAVVFLIWIALIDNRSVGDERLKAVTQRRNEFMRAKSQEKKTTRRKNIQRTSAIKQLVEKMKLAQGENLAEIRTKLRRAGYHARDAVFMFLFLKLALFIGLGAFSAFLFFVMEITKVSTPIRFLIVAVAAVFGWLLPAIFIKNLSQKREEVLQKAFPDALDLMVICAEAGLSLDASFDRVGREMELSAPELAEEIGLTSVELNFLPDRQMALRGLAIRIQLQSVTALVNTLIQTEKYGTPLAKALRVLSSEMRDERIMNAEEKAARLPAILTVPMILFILPPLFIVLIGPAAIKVIDALH